MTAAHIESDLREASARLADARRDFAQAVLRAHAHGMSLRQIADAAGISHETVRRLVRDAG